MRFADVLFVSVLIALPAIIAPAQQTATAAPSNPHTPAASTGKSTGGVQILSDTQGVDFKPFLEEWHSITDVTWHLYMPAEVDKPTLRKGVVADMVLEGRSGFIALDHAAWNAIRESSYPPLPQAFHGPYIELRALFLYNQRK